MWMHYRRIVILIISLAMLMLFSTAVPLSSDTIDSSGIIDTDKIETVTSPDKFFLNKLWYWLYNLLGPVGFSVLGFIFFIALGLYRKWPGSKWPLHVIYCVTHPIPKGDPNKLTVAIAQLDRDTDNRLQQNFFDGLAELRFEYSLEVLAIPRVITSRRSKKSARQMIERKKSDRLIRKAKADILIWGIAIGEDSDKANLFWNTSAGHRMSKKYQLSELLELPGHFVEDLRSALKIVVLTQYSKYNFTADQLELEVNKLKQNLESS